MVKQVVEFQCEICNGKFEDHMEAVNCEQQGQPDFSRDISIGSLIEGVVETVAGLIAPVEIMVIDHVVSYPKHNLVLVTTHEHFTTPDQMLYQGSSSRIFNRLMFNDEERGAWVSSDEDVVECEPEWYFEKVIAALSVNPNSAGLLQDMQAVLNSIVETRNEER